MIDGEKDIKNVLIVMWIVTGIIILATLYIIKSTDCLPLICIPFFATLFNILFS